MPTFGLRRVAEMLLKVTTPPPRRYRQFKGGERLRDHRGSVGRIEHAHRSCDLTPCGADDFDGRTPRPNLFEAGREWIKLNAESSASITDTLVRPRRSDVDVEHAADLGNAHSLRTDPELVLTDGQGIESNEDRFSRFEAADLN